VVLVIGAAAARAAAAQPNPAPTSVRVAGHTMQVPAGFGVDVYAEGLRGARFMALGPDGTPYLSITRTGRVVKLPDADGDGRADSVVTVASGLNLPHGLAFRGDTL